MKRILTVVLWIISVSIIAQTKNVTGKVTDESGLDLPGVTVMVKGSGSGTITDLDGSYSLDNLTSESVLQFSFIGMTQQEIVVGTQSQLSVTMVASGVGLDELIVIGYGSVRKSDLTGSVAVVDAKDAYAAPSANLESSIQGRAAGVQVTSSNGSPGSAPSIRIRGGNSITAGNEPLYVIDGFIGASTDINANDIETMQVLKDASSTAIYGSRGANGVIIITTKKGKNGATKVNLKSSFGMQYLPSKIDVQTGAEYAAWKNSTGVGTYDLDNLPDETDWQDVLINPASITDHQLSVSGGNEKSNYFLSAGYLNQDGIVASTGFERFSLRSNINVNISKIFSAGVNISLVESKKDVNDITFKDVLRADPLKAVYDENGDYNGTDSEGATGGNLLADNELNQHDLVKDRANINAYIQASIFDKVVLKSTFGSALMFSKEDEFIPSTNPGFINSNGKLGQADIEQKKSVDLLNENTINYTEKFGAHSIGLLGGFTAQKYHTTTTTIGATEIPSDGVGVNSVELGALSSVSSGYTQTTMLSYLTRASYSYQDKYLLTGTWRRDGSSRLGGAYANFPSVAAAWKIGEESFIQDIDVISNMKLRTSYGWTGNQAISALETIATYKTDAAATVTNGVEVAGVTQGNLAKPNLAWERTEQFDVGFEVGLFENRMSVEADFYYKKTHDLLLDAEVPEHTGTSTIVQNVGSLQNKGIDVSLSAKIVDTDDFQLDATLNISMFKNKVLDLGLKESFDITNLPAPSGDNIGQLLVGQPVGVFVGAIYDGIDTLGSAIFRDISGPDGVPDSIYSAEYDDGVIGSPNPDFYGGLQVNMRYKNFDLMASLPFSVGNDVYNMEAYVAGETTINSYASIREQMWSEQNKGGTLPRADDVTFQSSNTYFVQNGSFLRLATLQVGYTIPKGTISGISNCRLYATGTNLFVLKDKDYLGYDPDVSSYGDNSTKRGFDNIVYPQNRSFIVGLDITF